MLAVNPNIRGSFKKSWLVGSFCLHGLLGLHCLKIRPLEASGESLPAVEATPISCDVLADLALTTCGVSYFPQASNEAGP